MNSRLKRTYKLTDILLYPLVYYIIRYRRKVVRKNLLASFPELALHDIVRIEKQFYHHLTDIVAEIIFASHASESELAECIEIVGLEETEATIVQYGGAIYMLGHLGNWELTADVQHRFTNSQIRHYNVYHRLHSSRMDRIMLNIREKMSGEGSCIEKHILLRKMIQLKQQNQPHTIGLISDQKPRPETTHYWNRFLNQETGWLNGGEVLAKKFDYPVYYVHMSQTERGHYTALPQLITDHPKDTTTNYITEQFAQRLESNIRENPSIWLWTHNRWKWKRKQEE